MSDRIARVCKRYGATWAVALDISKAFGGVWHAGLLNKLKSYGISGQIFGLISSFLSNRWLQVVLDGKSSQEYLVNAGVPQESILGPTLSTIHQWPPDDGICSIVTYTDDTTLYSKCSQESDLCQQLELSSELESDLRDTGLGQEVACWFQCWKTHLVLFHWSKNTGAIDVKMDGSVLKEKWSLKMLSLLNWIGALTLSLLLKLFPRKLEPWFVPWSFFLLRLLCISLALPNGHIWNTVVMSELVLLVASWNCWINYKNGYAGLLVLHLLPLLNPWLIVEMWPA